MGYAFTCVIGFSDQLYVVDASLLELLQSPFGLFLQWECKTLESLSTLVQAKLHGDLRDRKIKQMAKPGRAAMQKAKCQKSDGPKPVLAPSESRFVYGPPENTTESSESVSNNQNTQLNQH